MILVTCFASCFSLDLLFVFIWLKFPVVCSNLFDDTPILPTFILRLFDLFFRASRELDLFLFFEDDSAISFDENDVTLVLFECC